MSEDIKSDEKKLTEIQPIYSMWLREVIRFFNMKPRVISTVVQPILFLALLALPMSRLFHGVPPQMEQAMFGGLNFFSFLVPGIVGIGLLFGGTMSGVTVLWDKDFGFLKEVMVAPVRRTSLMLGRTFGGLTTGMIQALITIGVASIFGIWYGFKISSVSGFLLAIVFSILTFFIFSCFGIILGGLFEETEGFMAFVNLIQMPLFFLSGAMIPVSQLKGVPVLYQIQFINPLTYGVDGLRSALTGCAPFFPLWIDLLVLIAVAAVFLVLGAYTFSRMEVD